MDIITTTEGLSAFCDSAHTRPYVTVDTEFLRERTYYSKLCLIQLALPGADGVAENGEAVIVDPLADGLSLEPLYELFRNRAVVKVFHAARQDLEIFFHDAQVFPEPLFDTQLAAMVAGFGDQPSYESLVKRIARAGLDKSSRFTDWSRRPLTKAQLEYAQADVTHLRVIYEHLSAELAKSGRQHWLEEEEAILLSPETYLIRPEEAWQRVKTRTNSGRFLTILRELAAFREAFAQERDIPRSRVFKDDALLELASTKPQSAEDLSRSRLLLREARRGDIAEGILAAVKRGQEATPMPTPKEDKRPQMQGNGALADLLRVLLKAKSEQSGVAAKLIASAAELDKIAAGQRDLAALRGWRHEVFGADALRLCEGGVALTAKGNSVRVVSIG